MKVFGRIVLLIVLCLAALAAAGMLLPLIKEGASWSDLPLILGAVAGLTALGAVWWWVSGNSLRRAAAGLVIVALPIAAHVLVGGGLIAGRLMGLLLPGQVSVVNYRETPIQWAGFDGPVGLELRFDLDQPFWAGGLVRAPEIRMGPFIDVPDDKLSATHTSGGGYFKDYYLKRQVGPLVVLKPVLFQKVHTPSHATKRLADESPTRLVYYLYPGTVAYLESPAKLCLASHTAGIPKCPAGSDEKSGCAPRNRILQRRPVYEVGADLSALWQVTGGSGMIGDLSRVITDALRKNSALQGDPSAWTALHKRLEPDGLIRAGYQLCPPGKDSHTTLRTCYCRP